MTVNAIFECCATYVFLDHVTTGIFFRPEGDKYIISFMIYSDSSDTKLICGSRN